MDTASPAPRSTMTPAPQIIKTAPPSRKVQKPEPVLRDLNIHFAEGHIAEPALEELSGYVTDHAGTIVADRQHATHLIVHPGSVRYRAELHNAHLLASQYPGLVQPKMVPYHWLCQIQLTNTLVDIDTLEPPLPIFYHPQMSEDNKPLIAWVSVNVTRNTDEQPSEAQGSVEQRLALGGALISTKRARADLLIVDESTQFAQKVRKERKEGKRWHQKLAERDWVDDCWNNKKLSWKVDDEGTDEDDEDLVRDMQVSSSGTGTGPGRPTGLPRNEYTAADDDFLARYIAKFHPEGSWCSRKTYEDMLKSDFPAAQAHSMESWLNRMKKNQTLLTKRIARYQRPEYDLHRDLTTRPERESVAKRKKAGAEKGEAGEGETGKVGVGKKDAGASGKEREQEEGKEKDKEREKDTGKEKANGSQAGSSTNVNGQNGSAKSGPSALASKKPLVTLEESSLESAHSKKASSGRPAQSGTAPTPAPAPASASAPASAPALASASAPVSISVPASASVTAPSAPSGATSTTTAAPPAGTDISLQPTAYAGTGATGVQGAAGEKGSKGKELAPTDSAASMSAAAPSADTTTAAGPSSTEQTEAATKSATSGPAVQPTELVGLSGPEQPGATIKPGAAVLASVSASASAPAPAATADLGSSKEDGPARQSTGQSTESAAARTAPTAGPAVATARPATAAQPDAAAPAAVSAKSSETAGTDAGAAGAGSETQAMVLDFMRSIQQPPPLTGAAARPQPQSASAAAPAPAPAPASSTREAPASIKNMAPPASAAVSADARPAKRPREADTAAAATPAAISAASAPAPAPAPTTTPGPAPAHTGTSPLPKSEDLPPPPRSAMRPPRAEPVSVAGTPIQVQDLGNGYTRVTTQLEARVVEMPVAQTSRLPGPSSAGSDLHTPAPGQRMSIMQQRNMHHGSSPLGNGVSHGYSNGIGSSAAGSAPRSSRKRHKRHHSPDTVYASPNIPPPPPPSHRAASVSGSVLDDFEDAGGLPPNSALARNIHITATAGGVRIGDGIRPRARSTPRPASPPLTQREREAKVYEGQAIAQDAVATYKRNITGLAERYGLQVGQVYKALDMVRKGTERLGWEEIRARLDRVYGYEG